MPKPPSSLPAPRRGRNLAVVAVSGASVLAITVAVGVAWIERGRVASHLAQRYLAERGVAADIVFDEVSPSRLTGRAVLGPANDPDATAERFEVTLAGGGFGPPRVAAIRLVHPTLKLRFDGRRLDFGGLQRLVDELGRGPAGGASPDVRIEGGQVRLITPGGEARVGLDAALADGRLTMARARIAAGEVGFRDLHLRLGAGQASLDRDARGAMSARFDLAAPEAAAGGAHGEAVRLQGEVALSRSAGERLDGPAQGAVTVEAANPRAGVARATRAKLAVDFDGALADDGRRFKGGARLRLDAAGAHGPAGGAGAMQIAADLTNLVLTRDDAGVGVSGHAVVDAAGSALDANGVRAPMARAKLDLAGVQGRIGRANVALSLTPKASVTASVLEARGAALRGLDARIDAGRGDLVWSSTGWGFAAPLTITARADGATLAGSVLGARALQARLSGPAAFAETGTTLSLKGPANGDLAAPPAEARRLAAAAPILGTDPAFQAAVVAAAQRVSVKAPAVAVSLGKGGWSFGLPGPVRATSASGARLVLDATAAHAAALSLSGGGLPAVKAQATRYDLGTGGALTARGRLEIAYSGETLDQARARLDYTAVRRGGVFSVALPACGEVATARFGARSAPLVTEVSARACPSGTAPALVLDRSGWRLAARFDGLGFQAPASQAEVGRGIVDLSLHNGARGEPAGQASVVAARVTDAAPMRRFEPLSLAGRLNLAQGVWRGPLEVKDAAGSRALATLQVRHVMATAMGHADIAAPRIVFAKGGLQPKDLTPIGADLVSDADGAVAFEGAVDWAPGGLTSGGRFTTTGFAFTSPFGRVQGAAADIRLTSLAPMISAPAQPVSATSIEWVLPLTGASASIALTADAIAVASAEAGVSGGKVRLDPVALPYDQTRGVQGAIHLDSLDLAALIDRFNLADKLTIQAKVSGDLPFAAEGGSLRFTAGKLYATGPGRLSIRPEALTGTTATTAAPGAPAPTTDAGVQGFALQALQDLAFDRLDAEVASRPMGRLGVVFHIAGRHDPPKGGEVHVGLLDLLRGRALQQVRDLPKGTEVNLTLDTSLNFDELLAAYAGRGRSEPVQGAAAKP